MTLKELQEQFPTGTTVAGFYDLEQKFNAHDYYEVQNIDMWPNAPLDWGFGAYPFIRYNNEDDCFECWVFIYKPVSGYIFKETKDSGVCASYSKDFGWQTFEDADTVFTINDEWMKENFSNEERPLYENRVEQAAHFFDPQAYDEGRILTTYDAVKEFCSDARNFK